jgi:hypothetical protein
VRPPIPASNFYWRGVAAGVAIARTEQSLPTPPSSGSGARAVRVRWRASRKGRGAADGLGTVYGVTRERIRQVEMMGLKKLSRGPLRERLASFIGG